MSAKHAVCNPFSRILAARAWQIVGDSYARLSIQLRDMAHAAWQRSREETDGAEVELRALVAEVSKSRRDAEWEAIERRVLAEIEARDDSVTPISSVTLLRR